MAFDHNASFDVYNGTPWFVYDCTIHLDADGRRIALFLLYLLLFMAGLAENALVLWVNWRRRHACGGVLFCVINVSLSDTMVIFTMPFFMLEVTMDKVWLWGRFLCKVTHLVYVINFYSSSFFLALMTLERYRALAHPGAPACFPPQHKRRWLLCASVWALALLLALLENVHVDLLEWDEPGCYMMPEHSFTEWFVSVSFICLVFQFLAPAGVIVTCNVLIARAVRAAPDVQRRRDVWLVHVYSLVFVCCWLPYHLVVFLLTVDDLDPHLFSCDAVSVLYFSFSLVQCLSLFHCVANPVLYNFLSRSFRNNLANAVMGHIGAAGTPAAEGDGKTAAAAAVEKKDERKSDADTSHSDIGDP